MWGHRLSSILRAAPSFGFANQGFTKSGVYEVVSKRHRNWLVADTGGMRITIPNSKSRIFSSSEALELTKPLLLLSGRYNRKPVRYPRILEKTSNAPAVDQHNHLEAVHLRCRR